jgi:DNA (cytosine-5)-methyltransferase 1
MADFFCGAGGTSTGALEALTHMDYIAEITAVNHWRPAIQTHQLNHPYARHFETNVDDLKPTTLYPDKRLDGLWASPSCRMHSQGNSGEIDDQDRASAHCVTRWAEILLPEVILIENVPQFRYWGPIHAKSKRPIKNKRGETFTAWLNMFRSFGYKVEYQIINCANYGDPTTRERIMIQCVRGSRRKITWPEPTHSAAGMETDLFGTRRTWVGGNRIINMQDIGANITNRKDDLCSNTLRRIHAGSLIHKEQPFLVTLRGTALEQLLLSNRSLSEPLPTISAGGIHAGICTPILKKEGQVLPWKNLPEDSLIHFRKNLPDILGDPGTFGKHQRGFLHNGHTYEIDLHYRMLRASELALGQGFRPDYQFTGTQKQVLKQIGNAVPRRTARAIFAAAVSGDPYIHHEWIDEP